MKDLCVLYEHPEWQKPLFQELERRGVDYFAYDLKANAYQIEDLPLARVIFNQASPSAYKRGNDRAVPFVLSLLQSLKQLQVPVINGFDAVALEISKTAQAALLHQLGLRYPVTLAFNDLETALERWELWPCLLKPEQGGGGARMFEVRSADEARSLFRQQPNLWHPDGLMLFQQMFPVAPDFGIVRMEFVGQKFLYAMRVVSHGSFNLCPSEVCNPSDGSDSACEIPTSLPVEFSAYAEIPEEIVQYGERIMKAGNLQVGGVEYLLDSAGLPVFFDINANSNLRPAVAREFGFDPFERVVDYLVETISSK